MMSKTTSTFTRYGKALFFGLLLMGVAFGAVPHFMDAPARDFVQGIAKAYTGMPYLFGYNATEAVNTIIERVVHDKSGRITREDVPAILTAIVREHRPDFSPTTVQFTTEAAFNAAVNLLPQEISDPRVLTPVLSLVVPRALSALAPSRLPPRYPDLAGTLFKAQLWYAIALTATVFGWVALCWGGSRTILSPQDEGRRTRQVNAIILVPFFIMLVGLAYFLITYRIAPPAVGLFSTGLYAKVTAWIVAVFFVALIAVYFGIALGVYLLPYFTERVSVLAVWRRLVFPPLTNWIGDLLHHLRRSQIFRYFTKLLFQHFAREMAQ